MSDTALFNAHKDRRARKRFRLPGKPVLSWLVAGVETVAVLALVAVMFGPGLASVLGALVYLPLAYRTWYTFDAGPVWQRRALTGSLVAWSAALVVAGGAVAMTGGGTSWGRGALVIIGGAGALMALRYGLAIAVARLLEAGRLQLERVALVGPRFEVAAVLDKGKIWKKGLQPTSFLTLDAPLADGTLEAFLDRCIKAGCTRIVFLKMPGQPTADRITELCKQYDLDVVFDAGPAEDGRFDSGKDHAAVKRPIGFTGTAAKRVFDLVFAIVALVFLSPLLLAVALAIRLESQGPALFRQERRGFNGRSFMIYKFRSMRVLEDGRAMRQAQKNDERITRIGSFLRATSIDELPQLLNVLKGEMSLIGPRPHAISHDSEMARMVRFYAHRNRLKPGISGWAQVNGYRGDTSTIEKMEGRVQYDLDYIENWSMPFDIAIVFLTVFSRKTRQNAY